MMSPFGRYLERCGVEFDTAVNVLTGGELGQTVSLRVAEAELQEQKQGVFGWGCWFCKFLDIAVQRNHCQLQFSSAKSPVEVYIRAGIAFGAGIGSVAAIFYSLIHLVF